MLAETARPYHASPVFGPLAVFDVLGAERVPPGSASVTNEAEAEFVLALYRQLVAAAPGLATTASIAVVSPYKAQARARACAPPGTAAARRCGHRPPASGGAPTPRAPSFASG